MDSTNGTTLPPRYHDVDIHVRVFISMTSCNQIVSNIALCKILLREIMSLADKRFALGERGNIQKIRGDLNQHKCVTFGFYRVLLGDPSAQV